MIIFKVQQVIHFIFFIRAGKLYTVKKYATATAAPKENNFLVNHRQFKQITVAIVLYVLSVT